MIRKTGWAFPVALLLVLSANSLSAQPKPAPTPSPSFANLLQRAKNGDATLDFKELRFAYTETPEYNPYNSPRDQRQRMFDALNAKQYEQVLEQAEIILSKNFLDLNGHFGASIANRELGRSEKAALHRFLFQGLVRSIEKSGDGKAPETAFVVISVDEEYVLIDWLGLRRSEQTLIHHNGHNYDLLKVLDPKTNQAVSYYFNIDKPFNWLSKKFK